MQLQQIIFQLGSLACNARGALSTPILGACSDSRDVRPGWLFCAMKGARLDGHDYIPKALEQGAVAIAAENLNAVPDGLPCFQMTDAYPALGILAEIMAGNPASGFRTIAVTGTNGKTTSAYLLRAILNACGLRTGMVGTVEYDVADGTPREADRTTPTPFKLQQLFGAIRDNGGQFNVIEASSHALEQGRLGTLRCAAAIFTNLTQDHLDYHLTMERYYQAKKLLFTRHLEQGAPAIINADAPYGPRLVSELNGNVLAFSFHNSPAANVPADRLRFSPDGTSYTLHPPDGDDWDVRTPLTGAYNAANTAGAVLAAFGLGLDKDKVLEAVATCQGAPGRLQPIRLPGQDIAVFVDYAHTDDALRNVLANLKQLPHRRLCVVFGCGGDRDRKKRPLMGKAACELADDVVVTSDNPRTEAPDAIIADILTGIPQGVVPKVIPDRAQAIAHAIQNATAGDIILLAGKGHEDYQEVNGVKHHFNDAEQALMNLRQRG